MNKKLAVFGLTVATSAMLFGSCSTIQNTNNTTKGGVIGGVAGGALGALIGNKAGSTAIGTIAGAAIGGAAGVLIGKKMDKQAAEIAKTVEGAEVTQAGEGIVGRADPRGCGGWLQRQLLEPGEPGGHCGGRGTGGCLHGGA